MIKIKPHQKESLLKNIRKPTVKEEYDKSHFVISFKHLDRNQGQNWSMPENTDHPTQKPEKLIAKIILASTNEGDFVLDPFLGSGTTSVVAKKLNRSYLGIEIDETFACLTEKRLKLADIDKSIQGYVDAVFWERNTLKEQRQCEKTKIPTMLLQLP